MISPSLEPKFFLKSLERKKGAFKFTFICLSKSLESEFSRVSKSKAEALLIRMSTLTYVFKYFIKKVLKIG